MPIPETHIDSCGLNDGGSSSYSHSQKDEKALSVCKNVILVYTKGKGRSEMKQGNQL